MQPPLKEESLWAASVAARLRLVQCNFRDDDPSVRQGFLVEELERALKDVPPPRHQSYLAALSERFPAWEAERPAPLDDARSLVTPETPESLLERLIAAAPQLSADTRLDFALKLEKAGLSLPMERGGLPGPGAEASRRWGIGADQPVDAERAMRLLVMLVELALSLDQLVWRLWKEIAPRSTVRKEADVLRLIGPFLTGSTEVSAQQVAQAVEKNRRMMASLLGAVGQVSKTFARTHNGRFAPDEIRLAAEKERSPGLLEGRMWDGTETKCWRVYKRLAAEFMTEAALDAEVQQALVKSTEAIMHSASVQSL